MKLPKLVFFWDNFGPLHVDRCEGVARKLAGRYQVIGLEFGSKSNFYDWIPEQGSNFTKVTLVHGKGIEDVSSITEFRTILRACLSMGRNSTFLMCHFDRPSVLGVSTVLRLLGYRVFTMGCSKFDDHERTARREFMKSMFYLPYNGGIGSGKRSRDYMRFMGLPASRVKIPYNVVSLDRIRELAGAPPAPEGVPFAERHFTMVARLIPEKNFPMMLKAMALYAQSAEHPRQLHVYGSGPLEKDIREQAVREGIEHLVHFHGFLQTADISKAYARSLALLLPSVNETFGNVVPEALAMGLPIVLSEICGARDTLVRSGVNGFVIESDNPEGMAFFMRLLSEDEQLWRKMCLASQRFSEQADSERFADAVEALVTM